jgi:hypothetical protein
MCGIDRAVAGTVGDRAFPHVGGVDSRARTPSERPIAERRNLRAQVTMSSGISVAIPLSTVSIEGGRMSSNGLAAETLALSGFACNTGATLRGGRRR